MVWADADNGGKPWTRPPPEGVWPRFAHMCHFLAPVGSMTTIGDASVFEIARRCGTTPLLKRGVDNAVLHYTSIQNRCTDHRLV
jgi:hypothetical protein